MNLFQELQRRKVLRTTIAYIIGSGIVAMLTQLLVRTIGLPRTAFSGLIILELVALPLVVAIAWTFDITPEGVEVTGALPERSRVAIYWKRVMLPAIATILILLAAASFVALNRTEALLKQGVVAVLPFQVSGDPQIADLRQRIPALVAARLTSSNGPQALSPRVVADALERMGVTGAPTDSTAIRVARAVAASHVLVGSVMGVPAHFTITTRLLSVTGGRVIAAQVNARADSLPAAVDRLVAQYK